MSTYEYTAVDARGRQQRGVLEGDTPRQVRAQLRERELIPLHVAEVLPARSGAIRLRRRSRGSGASAGELALFTRQLATLVRAGLPLEEALGAVAEQTAKPRLQNVVRGVRTKVMEGHALVDGLADFPQAFDTLYRATAAAGEQSGQLEEVLESLADYTEAREKLRSRIAAALIYPIVLVAMSLSVVSLMMIYVVPKVVDVFADTGQALPWLTVGVIAISWFLSHYGLWLLVIVVGTALLARQRLRQPGPRLRWHRLLLRLPVVGRMTRGLNTARFTRTLAILTRSGVPVLDSLRIAADVVTNLPMHRVIADAADRVREGGSLSRALGAGKLFPAMAVHLIASGESSGRMEQMLERAATQQDEELDRTISTMLALLEPLMIVAMAVVVFLIVIAILLPVIQLNQLVS